MIEEITEGKICAVVVYKLDRLSRSQKDTIFLLEDVFNPNKCDFISLNENFDTTTPYGKAMIGILSVFAQLERGNIRDRTRMGMYERVKAGLWMGGGRVPFGYDYDKNKEYTYPK
jgi:site-specific DNA recombinase